MGGGLVKPDTNTSTGGDDDPDVSRNQWKILPSAVQAREAYEKDGTLNKSSTPGLLELRTLLDETIVQQALGALAKKAKALEVFHTLDRQRLSTLQWLFTSTTSTSKSAPCSK